MTTFWAVIRPILPGLTSLTLGLAITAGPGVSAAQQTIPSPAGRAPDPQQLNQAANQYAALVREYPQSPELWSNLGAVRAMSGKCKEALPALERARSLNSRLFSPWYFEGYCYLTLHQDQRAAQSLQKATSINPKDPNAWFLKAEAEGNLDRLVPSFDAVIRSLKLDPNRADGYYLAGKTALDLTEQLYGQVNAVGTPNTYELMLEGERNASQGVWKLAERDFQKALRLNPGSASIQFELGSAFLEGGEYLQAEEAFRQALAAAPGSPWAKLRLGLALAAQGKTLEAAALCRAVSPEGLQLPEEFLDALRCASLAKLEAEERAVLQLARKRFPESSQFAPWEEGTTSSGGAIRLESLTGPGLAFRFLLSTRLRSGDFVRDSFPTLQAYQNFRDAFIGGENVRAAAVVPALLDAWPSDPARAFALGEVVHCLSLRFYEHLATTSPDSTPAMMLAAENYSALGQQDKAVEIYEAVLRKEGPSPGLLRDLAKIYWTEHRWDEALGTLASITSQDPNDPTIFVNLGRIYAFKQDERSAEKNFRRAAELDPQSSEAHLGLGQTLLREGDLDGALREVRAAATFDPQNARIHYELSLVYRKLGEKAEAEKEMSDFTRLQAQTAAQNIRRGRQLVPLD